MPRFYFVFFNGHRYDDPDGSDLPSLDTARLLAERSVRELKANAIMLGQDCSTYRFVIEDENRDPLLVVPFA